MHQPLREKDGADGFRPHLIDVSALTGTSSALHLSDPLFACRTEIVERGNGERGNIGRDVTQDSFGINLQGSQAARPSLPAWLENICARKGLN